MRIDGNTNIWNDILQKQTKKINNESKFTQILDQSIKESIIDSNDIKNKAEHNAKLMDACRELESVFVHQMISQMRSTVPQDGYLGQSSGEKIFQDMLDQEYAQKISKAGSLGLAEILYKQLSRE